jgi:amidase
VQCKIWGAGAMEDYKAVTSITGEPFLRSMIEESTQSDTGSCTDSTTAYELWQVQKKRAALRKEYLDHWEATVHLTGTGRPVDAILAPCAPYVAPLHGKNKCVLVYRFYISTMLTMLHLTLALQLIP